MSNKCDDRSHMRDRHVTLSQRLFNGPKENEGDKEPSSYSFFNSFLTSFLFRLRTGFQMVTRMKVETAVDARQAAAGGHKFHG